MSSKELSHLDLVQAQGAARHEGYNPIAPRSHRWMMDYSKPEDVRVIGWALWRTIDRDPNGKTGPAKRKRTIWAHDARGCLTLKHLAEDLGMEMPNASAAVCRLEESGHVRRNDKGHIMPRGDMPDARRIKEEIDEGEEKAADICTDNLPSDFSLYLQQFDETERHSRVAEYLKLKEYRKRLEADAIALARDAGDELEQKYFEAIGFKRPARQGRRKNDRSDCAVQLSLLQPPQLSVQITANGSNGHSVQSAPDPLYTSENGTVQISPSLLIFHSSHSSHSEVEAPSVDNSVSEAQPPPTAPPQNLAQKVGEPNPIIAAVEAIAGRKIGRTDPLRGKLADLPARFRITARSVCRWMEEKAEKKQKDPNYESLSPGALYKFALSDLPGWIKRHKYQINSDWQQENERRRGDPATPDKLRTNSGDTTNRETEPFDPLSYTQSMAALAAKKGMR